MPTTPKTVQPKPVKPATGGAAKPRAVRKKGSTETYTHFSDKITDALMDIHHVIDDNRGTLDSIQDMAIQLTRSIQVLRVVVMKYVSTADKLLETVVPIMDKLPVFPDSVRDFAQDALTLANKITEVSVLAEKVLPGVEASLMTADIAGLQASTSDVARLTRSLQDITR